MRRKAHPEGARETSQFAFVSGGIVPLAQTPRTNRMMPESDCFGGAFKIKKKGIFTKCLFNTIKITLLLQSNRALARFFIVEF